MKPWLVEATPRGVACAACGKPSEYVTPQTKRFGSSNFCGGCAIRHEDATGPQPAYRVARKPTKRTLVIYALTPSQAAVCARHAGYDVLVVRPYTEAPRNLVEGRVAPGA